MAGIINIKRPKAWYAGTKNDNEQCVFRLALLTLHNICAGLDNNGRIPQWLWDVLDKNGKKGFINCKDICKGFGANKIKEFWCIVYNIGVPAHFIHIDTDKLLTSESPNAHINIRVTSDIDYIQTTITGQKLLINLSLLNIQHAGKYMLYNNKYKADLDKIFVEKQNYCYQYYMEQCDVLKKNLILNGINKYYAKYAITDILQECLNEEIEITEAAEMKYDDNVSWNILMDELDLDKLLLNKKLDLVKNNDLECSEQDKLLHTFGILTNKHNQWISDNLRLQCQYKDCQCIFSGYHRKHHCRACGEIFCTKHWKKCRFKRNKQLDRNNIAERDEKWIKVCNECEQFYWFFAYQL